MTLNPQIKIDLPADPGTAGVFREELFTKIDGAPIVVTLSLGSVVGVTAFLWEIVDQPVGASASLSSTTAASPTFTADQDIPGTYLIRCTINFGTESVKEGISFSTEYEALRPPAAGETTEASLTAGWKIALSKIINLVDLFGRALNITSLSSIFSSDGNSASEISVQCSAEQAGDGDLTGVFGVLRTAGDGDTESTLQAVNIGTGVGVTELAVLSRAIEEDNEDALLFITSEQRDVANSSDAILEMIAANLGTGDSEMVVGSESESGDSDLEIKSTSVSGVGTMSLETTTGLTIHGAIAKSPEKITSTSAGVAASLATVETHITTNGDGDLDEVTLADGVADGQEKEFLVVSVPNPADSVKITPANLAVGTQITFPANPIGLGCIMRYSTTAGAWIIIGNNGGTIA